MFRAASHDFSNWPRALEQGVASASFYGGAKVGFRTMLDALIPASKVTGSNWKDVVEAAEKGANATKNMRPLAGRSSYLDQTVTDGTADPGAAAMVIALRAFSTTYLSHMMIGVVKQPSL